MKNKNVHVIQVICIWQGGGCCVKMVKLFQGWYQVFNDNELIFELIKNDGSRLYHLYVENKEVDCFKTVKEFKLIYFKGQKNG